MPGTVLAARRRSASLGSATATTSTAGTARSAPISAHTWSLVNPTTPIRTGRGSAMDQRTVPHAPVERGWGERRRQFDRLPARAGLLGGEHDLQRVPGDVERQLVGPGAPD